MTSTDTAASFCFDDFFDARDADKLFAGVHDPSVRWNGWANPRFDRAEAERVVAYFAACREENDETPILTWDGDVLVVEEQYDDGESTGEFHRIEADADGRYAIGNFAWCWNDLTDEDLLEHGVA